MQKRKILAGLAFCLLASPAVEAQTYGLGRAISPDEDKKVDITIGPEGRELPDGSGNAIDGAQVYELRCKECHGDQGVGGDQAALIGRTEQLREARPIKTVGSYWPFATTLFDYTRRAMPFEEPGTLSNDQVYAVTAYVLHLNGIIEEGLELNRETLPQVEMPNRGGFVRDPR